MSVSIDFDPNVIFKNIQKSTDVSLQMVAEKVIEDTAPFVPQKTGFSNPSSLVNSATIEHKSRNDIVIWYERIVENGEDVAPFLYAGIYYKTGNPVKHWTNPNSQPYWLEYSQNMYEDDWIEYFKEKTREIWRNRKK